MTNWIRNLLAKALGDTQSDSEPLVILRAICDAVDEKVKTLPRGRMIFPYKQLIVRFYAANQEEREVLRAGFDERNELQTRIRHHLERQNVEGAADLRVKVEIFDGAEPPWVARGFDIVYGQDSAATQNLSRPTLAILQGVAAHPRYLLKEKNKIGRNDEVRDKYGKLIQRNDIVFTDCDDEANLSVSRIQSRIEFDADQDSYLLYDDNSTQGTFIERDGRMLTVAGRRGVALKAGDVIYFGKARAAFVLQPDADGA